MFPLIMIAVVIGAVAGLCMLLGAVITAAESLFRWLGWQGLLGEPAPAIEGTLPTPPTHSKSRSAKKSYSQRLLPIVTYYLGDEMPKGRCYLFDQNISPVLMRRAQGHGLNVKTAKDVGLETAEDPKVLRSAWKRKRILVTHDRDFDYLSKEFYHCGVFVCAQGPEFYDEIIRVLLKPTRAQMVAKS